MEIKERQNYNFEVDLKKREFQLTELIMKNEQSVKQSFCSDSLVYLGLPESDPTSRELIKQADSKAS